MGQKIFIHHLGALGDLLLSLPAIDALRRPDDLIHLAGPADVVELLKKSGYILEGSDADGSFFLPLFMEGSSEPLAHFLLAFDRIALFTKDISSPLARNLLGIAPHAEVIRTLPPEDVPMHVSAFRMRQTGGADAAIPASSGLAIPSRYRKEAEDLLAREGYDFAAPLIAVHPGSGGKRKCWPIENYFALIETLRARHGPFVLIFSGPVEDAGIRGKVEAFVRGKRGIMHVCDKSLIDVAALLSFSTGYVGNDSGITHLAAAVTGNVVALFGPTDPVRWRPSGDRVRVISSASPGDSLSSISPEAVCEEVRPFLLRFDKRPRPESAGHRASQV